MPHLHFRRFCLLIVCCLGLLIASPVVAQPLTVLKVNTKEPRVYEKYEVSFTIPQTAEYPLFAYDDNPPAGVTPGIGISVEGIITTPSGKTLYQPAFYNVDVERAQQGDRVHYLELPTAEWMLRLSPQETGIHQVSISVTDASGTQVTPIGSFNAQAPIRAGFISVSKDDSRYFQFSNGSLFWPIGPAYGYGDYDRYKDTGTNFDRPWLAGIGAYSTNWARWLSSAENLGNEGSRERLNFKEHAPGSDLSYDLTYPDAFRYWITNWLNEEMGPQFKPDTQYHILVRMKTANLTGPRDPQYDWGVTARLSDWIGIGDPMQSQEDALRKKPMFFPHVSENRDWFTIETDFKTNSSPEDNVSIYLDNVTGGSAYIDEFQIREVLPDGSLGGSVIRNPKADMHTYVDPRGAADIDWMVEQAEKDGVYLKLVVHDKNDWIQAHLKSDGTFADEGDGYYQPENTRARWLLRQWSRYIVARWGYSTAVHSWELNNEGPPDSTGDGTAPHWETAQAFAHYMHHIDSHPHLATTSFWCCWRPEFWGNNDKFPDIDYADLHEYTREDPLGADMAAFHLAWSAEVAAAPIGKPAIHAETGITNKGWYDDLKTSNPGIWYRHLLWSSLDSSSFFEPGYWYSEHLDQIPQVEIARVFADFVNALDVNKGGYEDVKASISNPKIRVLGQKNLTSNKAYGWIQNEDFTWRSAMDGYHGSQTGTVEIVMSPNTDYALSLINTSTGEIEAVQNLTASSDGTLTITIDNLTGDVAFLIKPQT
jgi:hypothetical protein